MLDRNFAIACSFMESQMFSFGGKSFRRSQVKLSLNNVCVLSLIQSTLIVRGSICPHIPLLAKITFIRSNHFNDSEYKWIA